MTWPPMYKNAEKSEKKLLAVISEFTKVSGYKVDIHKSIVFLYTKNQH